MKHILTVTLLGLLLHGAQQSAEAVPITGELNMGGVASLNNSQLEFASGATSFSGVKANAASDGVFTDAGIGRAAITMNPFNWNPSSAPITPLWEFTYGGIEFHFNLDSLTVVSQTANFLNLSGEGTIYSSAYESATGSWSFTISDSDGLGAGTGNFKFGFQSSSTAAVPTQVPDGGATAMLVGLTFLGFAGIRRQKS